MLIFLPFRFTIPSKKFPSLPTDTRKTRKSLKSPNSFSMEAGVSILSAF